jgi:hypothetical protein
MRRLSPFEMWEHGLDNYRVSPGKLKQSSLPQVNFLHFLPLLSPFCLPGITPSPTPLSITLLAAHAAMSPFQNSHQPTHAGQPAGAFNFAPDEEPIASSFDGAGPPFDVTVPDPWMDFWDPESAFQSAFDPSLNDQTMLPPFHPGGELFDWTSTNWTLEPTGSGTGISSQSALGPALNEQATMLPFGLNPWVNQPLGQVASTSALFFGQAPTASDGAPFYPQDASFDLYQADWNDHARPNALSGFDSPIR